MPPTHICGEYAEAGIPLFWRVDLEPELGVHAYRLQGDRYLQEAELRGVDGPCPVPWGEVVIDLRALQA